MKTAKVKPHDPLIISLIEGCQRGEERSRTNLYYMFKKNMVMVCKKYFKDEDTIEEVLQDSFIKVFKKIGDFRLEGPIEGWIRRIVKNTAIDHIRRNKNKILFPSSDFIFDMDVLDDNDPEVEKEMKDRAGIVVKEMGKMSEAYRESINLFVIEDRSHKEIAVSLGIREGTSNSNFFRAKAKINKTLREKYPVTFWVKN